MKTKDIIKDAVNILGEEVLVLTMEECSELQKECSKVFRNKGNRENLIEEMGDVAICLNYLKEKYNITDKEIEESIDRKMYRTKRRIENGTLTMRGDN